MKKNTNDIMISACMMVKNEEKMLPRCLNSIKHLIDELIVVDTGSTDKTIEIAELFGAKIYHHPWENNFSKHRNQSLGYATGDWIILVDADEEFNAYHLKKSQLKKILKKSPSDLNCYLIKGMDKDRNGQVVSVLESIRIFRNNVGIEYRGIVHNKLHYTGKVNHLDIEYFHYGYALSDDQMHAKYKRTSGLLFKRIEENPKDYDAYFYLYQVHSEMGEKQEAVQYAQRCLALMEQERLGSSVASFYYSLYYGIANIFLTSGEYDQALSAVRGGLELLPDEVDLYYALAAVGYFSGQPDLAVEGGENYLRVVDDFRSDSSRSGTRFIFTTAKKAEFSVAFWLMHGLVALDRLNEFLELWETYKADMVAKPSFQKLLFEALEKKEAFEALEPMAVFLFNELEKVPVENHKMILSFLLFYLSEKMVGTKDNNSELSTAFEGVTARYLDKTDSYQNIPTGDAVILGDALLDKSMGQFFLDLTAAVFQRELAGQISVIDSNDTIIQGYKSIAEKQPGTRKGELCSLLCLQLCKKLAHVSDNGNTEPVLINTADARTQDKGRVPGQDNPVALTKNTAPLVSIGLPVYNEGMELDNTIKSILNQDFKNFELIICDDCSTDNTESICRKYADQDKRVRYVRNRYACGLVANWQNVVGLSLGPFFMFAFQGTVFYPNLLSACLEEYEADKTQSCAVVFPQVHLVSPDGLCWHSADPLNAVQQNPVERYLHVLDKLSCSNAVMGLMRTNVIKTSRMFFGGLSSRSSHTLYGDLGVMTEIALKGRIKQASQVLLDRRMPSGSDDQSMEQKTQHLINLADSYVMNDAITLYHVKMITRQMDVINYAPVSFADKNLLIKETKALLKNRYQKQMHEEIERAVSLVKARSFYCTWGDQRLPEKVLDDLPDFKQYYLTILSRELEDALLLFPELDDLKDAVRICKEAV